MQTRRYPRTMQDAFKHIDPVYAQAWEPHIPYSNLDSIIIRGAVWLTVALVALISFGCVYP